MKAADVNDIMYRCLSELSWLEEARYYWVIADELTWNRLYDRAAVYVKKSLQWLKRIILNRKAEGTLKEHVEQLIKEIELIDAIDALNDDRVLGLTTQFRHAFFHNLARCMVEEVEKRSRREG